MTPAWVCHYSKILGTNPTRRGSWQSVLIKLWQYIALLLFYRSQPRQNEVTSFLGSLKTCLDSWRNVLVACPTHPMWCYCFHPCCSYLTGSQTYSSGHNSRYSTPQSRAEKLIIIEYFCDKLTEMAAAKQTKTTQPTPNQCHAPVKIIINIIIDCFYNLFYRKGMPNNNHWLWSQDQDLQAV